MKKILSIILLITSFLACDVAEENTERRRGAIAWASEHNGRVTDYQRIYENDNLYVIYVIRTNDNKIFRLWYVYRRDGSGLEPIRVIRDPE